MSCNSTSPGASNESGLPLDSAPADLRQMPEDGGPAFPLLPPVDETGRTAVGYPFPSDGMSLRDHLAGRAMQGWLASYGPQAQHPVSAGKALHIARQAYAMADAMLVVRKERQA